MILQQNPVGADIIPVYIVDQDAVVVVGDNKDAGQRYTCHEDVEF